MAEMIRKKSTKTKKELSQEERLAKLKKLQDLKKKLAKIEENKNHVEQKEPEVWSPTTAEQDEIEDKAMDAELEQLEQQLSEVISGVTDLPQNINPL